MFSPHCGQLNSLTRRSFSKPIWTEELGKCEREGMSWELSWELR